MASSYSKMPDSTTIPTHPPELIKPTFTRTCSSASHRFNAPPGEAANLHGSLRRAFSVKRSSSVADGYWRIQDSREEGEDGVERGGGKKKAGIIKACKRLFGIKSKKNFER